MDYNTNYINISYLIELLSYKSNDQLIEFDLYIFLNQTNFRKLYKL